MPRAHAAFQKRRFFQWFKNLFQTEHGTGRTCPACGGRIVDTLSQVSQVYYCERCKRIDDPDV